MVTGTDQVDDGPRDAARTDKPWGYQLMFAVTPSYAGGVDVIREGHTLSLQYHHCRDETLYLHDGRLLVELEDKAGAMQSFEMEPGQSIHFCPPRKHRVTALKDSIVFEVSTPHLNDIVRLEDRYGRGNKRPDSTESDRQGQQSHASRAHRPQSAVDSPESADKK